MRCLAVGTHGERDEDPHGDHAACRHRHGARRPAQTCCVHDGIVAQASSSRARRPVDRLGSAFQVCLEGREESEDPFQVVRHRLTSRGHKRTYLALEPPSDQANDLSFSSAIWIVSREGMLHHQAVASIQASQHHAEPPRTTVRPVLATAPGGKCEP